MTIAGSCDERAKFYACTEYTPDAIAALGGEAEMRTPQRCAGAWSTARCPTDGSIGSCASGAGFTHFYADPLVPDKAKQAKEGCAATNGRWVAP